jgi:hypothetical protein
MSDIGIRALRRFVLWQVLKCSAVLIVWVALGGVLIPDLVNARDNAQLFAAIVLAVGMLALTVFVVTDFVIDFRKFVRAYHILEKEKSK